MLEPQKEVFKIQDYQLRMQQIEGETTLVYRGDKVVAAIPHETMRLAGYLQCLNQLLGNDLSVAELVRVRQEAGRIFEQEGK